MQHVALGQAKAGHMVSPAFPVFHVWTTLRFIFIGRFFLVVFRPIGSGDCIHIYHPHCSVAPFKWVYFQHEAQPLTVSWKKQSITALAGSPFSHLLLGSTSPFSLKKCPVRHNKCDSLPTDVPYHHSWETWGF